MTSDEGLNRVAAWLGMSWSDQQRSLLLRYEEWLLAEALPAGGIGPDEGARLFDRHIADSLAFVRQIDDDARALLDVGTGAGLPAVPIAIALEDIEVVAIDRAERRTQLASRALRILGLPNLTIRTDDVRAVKERFDVVTFRASLPLPAAASAFLDLVGEDGVGIFALTRSASPPPIPGILDGVTLRRVEEGVGVLDTPAWFLRMTVS